VVVRLLDGWGAIAQQLTERAGVEISKQQARRWAQRADDPLPVRRIGRLFRQRVVASPKRIDAWALAEFGPDAD
jgi:hypothetical protein